MIMTGINGVNLVANNVNNRRNNNNDNNNENNDNSVQLNEADTEGDINAVNPPVVLPPVVGKRKKRSAAPSSPLSMVAVSASLAWLRAASANIDCLSRTVCEVSRELWSYPAAFGLVATLGIAQSSGTADAESLLRAARTGRARAKAPSSTCAVYHHVSVMERKKHYLSLRVRFMCIFQACSDSTFADLTLSSQTVWLRGPQVGIGP